MRALVAAIAVASFSVVTLAGCGSTPADDPTGSTESAYTGGCRQVCPRCPPNQICPMIACYLDCNGGGQKTCTVSMLCAIGYEWSQARCACVPVPSKPSSCATDADCRTYSNYCGGGCECLALSTSEPDPAACANPVACLVDPCASATAVCMNGACSLE
jgi:hypothetical protein